MPDDPRPDCPPCPDCPDCDTNQGPLMAALRLVEQLVMDSPANPVELVWRAFAVLGLAGLLVTGWIGWRYPGIVQGWLEGGGSAPVSRRIQRSQNLERQVIEAIAVFIRVARPARFALLSVTGTTAETVWATGDVRTWPVNLQGTLGPELVTPMGQLVFGECATLDGSGPPWYFCPISEGQVTGLVAAQWQGHASPTQARALAFLAQRIQGLSY